MFSLPPPHALTPGPVTPTAGVVLSSVGLGGSFLVSVILGFGGCKLSCRSWMKDKLHDVRKRRQKTKG